MSHVYNADFYSYICAGARRSARAVIPRLQAVTSIESVLDIGAGQGAWAAEWLHAGVCEVIAVDGDYALNDRLLVPSAKFVAHDLSRPLNLGRRFDLVQTLEVAEHIPEEHAETFIDTLVAHGDVILFSAAVPNQGGEHHVNEQPPEYWRRHFAARGYVALDWLRPQLRREPAVMPWYRYNSILYANGQGFARLSPEVRAFQVADDEPIMAGGSLGWKIRRGMVGLLPPQTLTWIAKTNAALRAQAAGRAKTSKQSGLQVPPL